MIYQTDTMQLKSVGKVFRGTANEVHICKDIQLESPIYYTLIIIYDHEITKEFLEIQKKAQEDGRDAIIESFSFQGNLCIIFPYKMSRPIEAFYIGNTDTLKNSENVCRNFIIECIASKLPYQFLYLILTQGQVHIEKDKSVFFGYELDMSCLDKTIGEQECVIKCGNMIAQILEPHAKANTITYVLLQKRLPKSHYERFVQLYQDFKMASIPQSKIGIRFRVKALYSRQQDALFRCLLIICICLGGMALLMVISQIIFGDIPFLRLFSNPFKMIGTESLIR